MSDRLIIRTTGSTGPSGGGGGGGATVLDDLTDVTITAAASGDILRHNGTAWVDAVGTTFFEAAGAAAAAQAASQPLDSDLTAIAALSTTAYGRAFLTLANQAATMALLSAASDTASGIVELATNAETATGTDTTRAVTPANVASVLASYLTTSAAAAGYQPLDSDLTAIAALTTTAYGRAFLALANQAALMALLSAASDTASGIVELATTAETTTGTDIVRAVTPAGLLNATTASNINARIAVKKAGSVQGTRRGINFIEGSGVTITTADDSGNEEVDVTIAASGGGTAVGEPPILQTSGPEMLGFGICGARSTRVLSANTMSIQFAPVFGNATFSESHIYVRAASASGNARVGLYRSSSNTARTWDLVSDLGAVSTATTGRKQITGLSISVTPGWYMVVVNVDQSVTLDAWAVVTPIVGTTVDGPAGHSRDNSLSQTYGALPSTVTITGVTGSPGGQLGYEGMVTFLRSA